MIEASYNDSSEHDESDNFYMDMCDMCGYLAHFHHCSKCNNFQCTICYWLQPHLCYNCYPNESYEALEFVDVDYNRSSYNLENNRHALDQDRLPSHELWTTKSGNHFIFVGATDSADAPSWAYVMHETIANILSAARLSFMMDNRLEFDTSIIESRSNYARPSAPTRMINNFSRRERPNIIKDAPKLNDIYYHRMITNCGTVFDCTKTYELKYKRVNNMKSIKCVPIVVQTYHWWLITQADTDETSVECVAAGPILTKLFKKFRTVETLMNVSNKIPAALLAM